MFRVLFLISIITWSTIMFGQDYSDQWDSHYSYLNIKDISKGEDKIYAASDNAVFYIDVQTGEIETITTVNGLSGDVISAISYSEAHELLIIGYENGLIEIVFDNDDDVLRLVDIFDKTTIPTNDKRINHFNLKDNLVYISTNFGISIFNLERLEFGDTYFIGNLGEQVNVKQTTIFNGYLYAACTGGSGIRKANLSNPNLIDYQNWEVVISGSFTAIESNGDKLYTQRTNRRFYELVNNVLNEVAIYDTLPSRVDSVDGNLAVAVRDDVFVYDGDFNLIAQVSKNDEYDTQFSSAILDGNNLYVGTKDFGVLKTNINDLSVYEEIHPDGPILNKPFSLTAHPNGIWVTHGEHDLFLNPYPLNRRGISHLKNENWINTPYEDVLEAKCLKEIVINPFNNNQVFIGAYFDGLLEVNDEEVTNLWDETNSVLEPLIDSQPTEDVRVSAITFDEDGTLWTLTNFVEKAIKTYNPASKEWKSYDLNEVIPEAFDNLGYNDIVIDNDKTKWIGSYNKGVIAFNENLDGKRRIRNITTEAENMPSELITALALDKRNQLWIGTFRGLRVLVNPSTFFDDDNVRAEEIIIEEEGVAKELLFSQFISDIVVDGANNKWVGTINSGLFYFSQDGQKTIFHFTIENSPLPSNDITDLSLDETTGRLYIATNKGLVSFLTGSSSTTEDFSNSYAYPNPVRPTFNITTEKVKIKDIPENVNIKITDIEGNLVAEAQSEINQRHDGYNLEIDGGTAFWNGKNLANNVVASGVYLIMLADLDSLETKVIKLMVVR